MEIARTAWIADRVVRVLDAKPKGALVFFKFDFLSLTFF
jgi:hypothetical protein